MKFISKSLSFTFSFLLCVLSFQHQVIASETSITETNNGTGSQNQAIVSLSPTVTTQQNNSTTLANTIDVSLSTGNNTASQNTNGSTSIMSGDGKVVTSIANTGNNSVTQQCCSAPQTTVSGITGNGSGSQNTISGTASPTTSVMQGQTAIINNYIHVSADTGHNTASYNNGGTTITSGDTSVQVNVHNKTNEQIHATVSPTPAATSAPNHLQQSTTEETVKVSQPIITIQPVQSVKVDVAPKITPFLQSPELTPPVQMQIPGILLPPIQNSTHHRPSLPLHSGTTVPIAFLNVVGFKELRVVEEAELQGKANTFVAASLLPEHGNNKLFIAMFCNIVMMFSLSYVRLRSGRSPGKL